MNLNELIDYNINRINNGDDNVHKLELKGIDDKILSESQCLTLFNKLLSELLIDTDSYGRLYLLDRAYQIINYGGWVKYVIDSETEKIKLNNRNEVKENIEVENLKLQKEALEYQKSIRDKEEHIRQLTSDNLRLGNWDIRLRWYIAVVTFILGIIAKYLIDK